MKKIAIAAGIVDLLLMGLFVFTLFTDPSRSGVETTAQLSADFESNEELYGSADPVKNFEIDASVSYRSSNTGTAGSAASRSDTETPPETAVPSSGNSSGSDPYAGFVFPDSNTVLITTARMRSTLTDAATCRRAINELYARRGYLFTKQENRDYFNTYSWYKNMAKESDMTVVARRFSNIEKQNVENLQAFENSMGWNQ
ncbi:MAG: YARHG domain-containing protein [Lachnospiraceae bacterium]|nr:YARHG domain-containing protein [Lachnospiraceae bacterium]